MLLRNVGEAVACLVLVQERGTPAISIITEMELVVGCRNKSELRVVDGFVRRFQVVKLNALISDAALALLHEYRLSHGLLIADALVAATALSLDRPFVSKNRRDYAFIPGLRLLAYPDPFAS